MCRILTNRKQLGIFLLTVNQIGIASRAMWRTGFKLGFLSLWLKLRDLLLFLICDLSFLMASFLFVDMLCLLSMYLDFIWLHGLLINLLLL